MTPGAFASRTGNLLYFSATGGPKREIAVRIVTNTVRDAGHSMVFGSMEVKRNRFRGQWRKGWIATCQAVENGLALGLPEVVEVPTRQQWRERFYQPKLDMK